MDNIELITLCRQGKMDAFNELYSRYAKKALRTAYLIVGNKNIAEDIVQEAFIECFRSISKLQNPEVFEAWFNKLLIRICWKMSAKERRYTYDSLDETYDENIFRSNQITDPLESYDINNVVRASINKLDTPLRTTIILFYYNDMSIKDIAKVLNCFQGTVKSRLHNARKFIEKELGKEDLIFHDKPIEYREKECAIND